MNMRMRVHTCALSLLLLMLVCLNKIMPPKGGSERSELTPCNNYKYNQLHACEKYALVELKTVS